MKVTTRHDRGTTFGLQGQPGRPEGSPTHTFPAADFDTLYMYGAVAHQAGQHERALGFLARAILLKPTPAAYCTLSEALIPLGRAGDALASAQKAVALEPSHAEAHNNCGIALRALGRLPEAVASFDQAIALQANHVAANNNRGIALQELGRLAEALESFDRAIALRSDVAEVHNNRSNTLRDLGRFAEAVAGCDHAIECQPKYAPAHTNRGTALQALNRFDEALRSHQHAIELQPDFALAHSNRAVSLQSLGRLEEALASCDRAIALQPTLAAAHNNRGLLLQALKRRGESVESYRRAIALQPNLAEAHDNLGTVLRELGRLEESLESLTQACELQPGAAGVYSNLGNTLRDLERPEEALTSYDLALQSEPDRVDVHCNRGAALADLGRTTDAIASYDRAVALDARHAVAHFNKSRSLLLSGQLEQGFRLYEWRKELDDAIAATSLDRPLWLGGQDIAGKTLFVEAEQGLGDTIHFCRYVRLAEERGARVVLAVQPALRALMQSLSPTIEVIAQGTRPDAFDYYCPLLSLPLAFQTTIDAIPAGIPYLQADPERCERWRLRLGSEGFRVGVCWQGSRKPIDVGRSFTLDRYQAIAAIPGVRLISLQKGDGAEQLRTKPQRMIVEELGDDFDADPGAFLDTAAVMRNLHLVVTADTSVAHLAGALGYPAWVALKHVPDWRWLQDRSDSPWYPTLRLFRQPRLGDWDSVFVSISQELEELLTRRAADAFPDVSGPAVSAASARG